MRESVFELIPLWLTGVFLDITDLKVATRPASRSCGKWLKLLRGGAAAALHCPGPPPQLQGESCGAREGSGGCPAWETHCCFSLRHLGLWAPHWVLSTNLQRAWWSLSAILGNPACGRGASLSTCSAPWHPNLDLKCPCHNQAPTYSSCTKPQG